MILARLRPSFLKVGEANFFWLIELSRSRPRNVTFLSGLRELIVWPVLDGPIGVFTSIALLVLAIALGLNCVSVSDKICVFVDDNIVDLFSICEGD